MCVKGVKSNGLYRQLPILEEMAINGNVRDKWRLGRIYRDGIGILFLWWGVDFQVLKGTLKRLFNCIQKVQRKDIHVIGFTLFFCNK